MSRSLPIFYIFGLVLLSSAFLIKAKDDVAKPEDAPPKESETSDSGNSTGNGTGQDLYVIRQVVYEIGILTDAGNDTESSNETHEQIDVSFFDPYHNGSSFDLSNIPVPIQTNVSGVSLTGILRTNLQALLSPDNVTGADFNESSLPLLPDKQIRVTHNVSTVNKEKSAALLSGLNDILGLDKLGKKNDTNDDSTKSSTEKTTEASKAES